MSVTCVFCADILNRDVVVVAAAATVVVIVVV